MGRQIFVAPHGGAIFVAPCGAAIFVTKSNHLPQPQFRALQQHTLKSGLMVVLNFPF